MRHLGRLCSQYVLVELNSWPREQCVFFLNWAMPRPLLIMSLELSDNVPMKRCAGFTHTGRSQRWQTTIPEGIAPIFNSYEMR